MTVPSGIEVRVVNDMSDSLVDEEWIPDFMKRALDVDYIPVIYYDKNLKDEVLNNCIESDFMGARHIRLGPDRDFLVCLTTKDKIFVLNMMLTDHVEFLKELLLKDLNIYMLGSQYVADRLDSEFGLKLQSTLDLNTFDIFLSLRKFCLNGLTRATDKLSLKVVKEVNLRFRDIVELQRHWLQVNMPNRDRKRERQETEAIRENPDSVRAKNVIRSRAFATRALAKAMNNKLDALLMQDSDNLYSFALEVCQEDFVEYTNRPDKDQYSTVMHFINGRQEPH